MYILKKLNQKARINMLTKFNQNYKFLKLNIIFIKKQKLVN